jgi:very-short-patch-repair endonuclease
MKQSQETRNCIQCNDEFVAWKNSNKKHCSDKCARKTVKEKNKRFKTGVCTQCIICQSEIYIAKWEMTKKYCSNACKTRGLLARRLEIKCSNEFCSNIVLKTENEIAQYVKRNAQIFCTVKCNNINRSQKASKCLKHSGTRPELKFEEMLKASNIEYIFQYSMQWKRGWKKWYDFYIPEKNMLIEIDGDYWHGKGLSDAQLNDTQLQSRLNDIQKSKLAQSQGYNLLRIWESDIDLFNINLLKNK